MLCSHAYCAAIARDACDSGVRIADRMEVGGRARRHAFLGSSCSGCHQSRNQLQQSLRASAFEQSQYVQSALASRGRSISRFRNLHACRGRCPHQYRRPSQRQHSIESSVECGGHIGPVSRRAVGGRLSGQRHGVFAYRSCPRSTLGYCSHHGFGGTRSQNYESRALYCPTGVDRAATGRSCIEAASEAAASQAWRIKQLAFFTAQLRRSQRRSSQDRSANQHAQEGLSCESSFVDRSTEAV